MELSPGDSEGGSAHAKAARELSTVVSLDEEEGLILALPHNLL